MANVSGKPNTGDPGFSGSTKASVVVGSVVDYINAQPTSVKQASYGAVGDGVADDTTAIQNALNDTISNHVFFPAGTYNHTGLTLRSQMQLEGERGTILKYTPTGTGIGIDGRDFSNVRLRGLNIQYSSTTYTGKLLHIGKNAAVPFGFTIENCNFAGSTSSANGATLIEVNGLLESTIRQCSLGYCNVGIDSTGANLTNVITISGLVTSSTQATTAWIQSNGNSQAWRIEQCAFEPITGTAPGGIVFTSNGAQGITILNNYFGDNTAAGNWISVAQMLGLSIIGNRINVGSNATGIVFTANTSLGVTIIGNYFDGSAGGVPIDFGTTTGNEEFYILGNGKPTGVTPLVIGTKPTVRSLIDNGIGTQGPRGVTGSRPSAVNGGVGTTYYDTTLSKPIWSDGTVWRDAAGTAV